jgi:uncharacterized protein (DUF608 family)
MAQALQLADDSVAQHYRDLHQSAARVYNESLWNPSVRFSARHLHLHLQYIETFAFTFQGYFNYDTSTSTHHDSIQADQLCGQWYARACGLPSIAPEKRIVSALKTVFANNVKKAHTHAHMHTHTRTHARTHTRTQALCAHTPSHSLST